MYVPVEDIEWLKQNVAMVCDACRCAGTGTPQGRKSTKAHASASRELHEGDWSQEASAKSCGAGACGALDCLPVVARVTEYFQSHMKIMDPEKSTLCA
jgi:hypothetical protein